MSNHLVTQGTVPPRKSADIIQELEFLTGSKDVEFDTRLGVLSLKVRMSRVVYYQ